MLGPLAAGDPPEAVTLQLRRYRCRQCTAVVTVAPRGVLYRLLYSGLAVALALSLWVVEGMSSWRIRGHASPRLGSDSEREHGWRAVSRWSREADRWWRWMRLDPGGARTRAHHIVQQLAGRAASATGSLADLALEGALRG